LKVLFERVEAALQVGPWKPIRIRLHKGESVF
jgi:hypothetical protein